MIFLICLLIAVAVFGVVYELMTAKARASAGIGPMATGQEVWTEPFKRQRQSVAVKLDSLGVRMPVGMFFTLSVLSGIVVLTIGLAIRIPVGFALAFAAVGAYLPSMWLNGALERKSRDLAKELPPVAEDLAGALRVRRAVRPAIEEVKTALELVNPQSALAAEFGRVLADIEIAGGSVPVALQKLQDRSPNADLSRLAGMLMAFHAAGADMLDILADKAKGMRAILEQQSEMKSLLSEQRMVQKVAPLMVILTYFFLNSDAAVRKFQASTAGQLLVLVVVGAMALGYFIIQTMIKDAEP